MSQTVWNRRWRQKQALKAQLFDELTSLKELDPATIQGVGPEVNYAALYFVAHPWAVLGGSHTVAVTKSRNGNYVVHSTECAHDAAIAVVAAALKEITSTPVFAWGEDYYDQTWIAKAADITRRMREAGIWTGPR